MRAALEGEIEALARGLVEGQGGRLSIRNERGYPVLVNHAASIARAGRVARAIANVVEPFPALMAAEDFAYYLERVPGAFLFLGSGGAGEACFMNHHPRFDVDERCLPLGAALLAGLALDALGGGEKRDLPPAAAR
ncbi:MAG: M20/M25/M40 family metallo-hydrolase [Planctomycetota bacterium]